MTDLNALADEIERAFAEGFDFGRKTEGSRYIGYWHASDSIRALSRLTSPTDDTAKAVAEERERCARIAEGRTNMADELVERLRGAARGLCTEDPHKYMARGVSAGDCIEAADRIQQLQARVEALEGALRSSVKNCPQCDGDGRYTLYREVVPCEYCETARAALGRDE